MTSSSARPSMRSAAPDDYIQGGPRPMMRSLWTASTGMIGQQFNVDVISNNLANVNSTAFKKDRVDFEDLMYQRMLLAGTPTSGDVQIPTGIQVGSGTRVAATQKMFEQGSLKRTANPLDIAVE